MSILSKVTTGKRGRAQKVVIYGPEGFGKSTLASQFPAPLFLDVEDSTSQLDVRRLGREELPNLKAFESALLEVISAKPCGTLVVDTADWLEEMAAVEVCETHKVEHLEKVDGGYGKGYNYLTTRITGTLALLDRVIDAGIHVVLLAHCSIVRFDPPDGAGAFDRYELKLYKDRKGGKGTASLIKEWADMVLFGNWRVQIAEKGKGDKTTYKGIGGKERMLYCNRTAAWDAKNRHGMGDLEKWEIATIEKAFRDVGAPWGNQSKQIENENAQTKESETPTQSPVESPQTGEKAKSEVQAPIETGSEYHDFAKICEPHADAVTQYLVASGRLKAGQPWTDIPVDFVKRVLKNPAGFLKVVKNGKAVTA